MSWELHEIAFRNGLACPDCEGLMKLVEGFLWKCEDCGLEAQVKMRVTKKGSDNR